MKVEFSSSFLFLIIIYCIMMIIDPFAIEVEPQSELSDFIQLQKEIKRLNEDNSHLVEENRDLLKKLKAKNSNNKKSSVNEEFSVKQRELEETIESLRKSNQVSFLLFFVCYFFFFISFFYNLLSFNLQSLKSKLESEKDKNQQNISELTRAHETELNELRAELESSKLKLDSLSSQLNEKQSEIDELKRSIELLEAKQPAETTAVPVEVKEEVGEEDAKVTTTLEIKREDQTSLTVRSNSSSNNSNKSDDGWCINGTYIYLLSEL